MSGELSAETRAVIALVLEALDIPSAATVGDDETRQKILDRRLLSTVVTLRSLVAEAPNLDWALDWLRMDLARSPAAGYVTSEQARKAVECGATYSQAVTSVEAAEAFARAGVAAERADCPHDCDEVNCSAEECSSCACCGVPEAAAAAESEA